ncbi:hypothetical protein MesoLjLc_68940 [Mesorhizobium sp. L-8-10]|nr:hypothetical protein MesoLjLc_68940 [Mesorhizobium sp. L-8-10]
MEFEPRPYAPITSPPIWLSITDRADALMTDPDDLARTVGMLIDLANHASVAESSTNRQLEEFY